VPNVFSVVSAARLATAHPDLQRLAHAVLARKNISVLCGRREEADQEEAYANKTSDAHYGESPHNLTPSYALDLAPVPCRWDHWGDWVELARVVLEEAAALGIKVTWGGTFKSKDGPHFELAGWRLERDKQFGHLVK
jgi:peptidoglycan L-alanyl-D-glutamate endopeptidase CwlK